MPEVASQTLDIVGRELSATLASARVALEGYGEQPENTALLTRCQEALHEAYGVLRLLEIYGAGLLAEEMEQVVIYLQASSGEKKNQQESLDALMRAMVQLPAYLERVFAGGRDLALVLLPLANDLRAVRGSELLSEGTLLLLNLKSDAQPHPQPPPVPGEPVVTVEQWARKLRSRFQQGLVGWLRGDRPEVNLEALAAVAAKLEEIATRQSVFQLWWVFGALIEALQAQSLGSGEAAVKRLLGLGDREIRRLYELGEARYAQSPPQDLLNSLLYYVGQATSNGPRVTQVRESFRLAELLPVDHSIDEERQTLSGPSVELMQTVARAIREDLSKVKDVLDIFVRRGAGQPKELAPQVDLLRKMGDTMAVLGLGELRARVLTETERLEKIVAGRLRATESTLLDIAATLIEVENALEEQLRGRILPRQETHEENEDKDFQQVQAAVLKECILNLARIKELIAASVSGSLEPAALDAWPDLMKGLRAGLLMLGKTRAVEVIAAITVQLKRILQVGARPAPAGFIDRLADAIVSVEYYMETLQAGRSDPWYMLDNAQSCVQALAQQGGASVAPLDPGSFARPVPASPPIRPKAAEIDDPDVLKLFIEEAHEELNKIQRFHATWDQEPQDREALMTVRRSFHTLKGSGRMVGATELGEFAWAIENLLNKLLDATLERTPPVVEVLREAVSALPMLIDHLESGRPLQVDAAALVSRAQSLASGQSAPAPAPARAAPEEVPEPPSRSQSSISRSRPSIERSVPPPERTRPDVDGTLRAIYSRETSSHVATVRSYLARESKLPEPHFLPEDVYRACHTLSGSSKMAQARHGARLADPLDHWLRRVFTSGVGLRNQDLSLLADCMAAMESVVTHLDEPTGYFVNHQRLAERIAQADKALEARLGPAATPSFTPPPPKPPVRETPVRETPPSPFNEVDLDEFGLPDPGRDPEVPLGPASEDRLLRGEEPHPRQEATSADFEPEVAATFSEEALELLEGLQDSLGQWRSDPGNAQYRSALKRPLHTLKGGARMVGLISMGDLSHELETLIMQIDQGMLQADQRVFDVVQASLDELARMREHVAKGSAPPSSQMIARIQALSRGIPAPRARAPQPQRAPAPERAPPEPARTAKLRPVEDRPEPSLRSVPPTRAPEPARRPRPAAPVDLDEERTRVTEPTEATTRRPRPRPQEADPAAQSGATSVSIQYTRSAEWSQDGLMPPQPVPPGREPAGPVERQEMARIDAALLDTLLNTSGEASIARSRLEQQITSIDGNITELSRTVIRLKEQLRSLEIEIEAQIKNRHVEESADRGDFDPLELDRYSSIQQFSRALAETANDVGSLQQQLETLGKDTLNLLQQQGRQMTELQNGLMRTRMVSFQRHVQRLSRIVRQAAADTGKRAELIVEGASGELDRQVLERMLPPFEHMLRNSVVHGIERPEERIRRGKAETGRILLEIHREGAEVMVRLSDDGAGMNLDAIRRKGQSLGLIAPGQSLSDEDAMQLILEPGFSTAHNVTQNAGRGVGMDVVATEIKRLGGALHMETKAGEGTIFTIRLPFTLAISTALVVRAGEELYALPLPTVESVVRLSKAEVLQHLGSGAPAFEYNGQTYRFQPLATFVGLEPSPLNEIDDTIPVVLVRAGEHSSGLVAEELVGSREIVVKSVGPQISSIRGISGATILGDGRIVIILDIGALVRAEWRNRPQVPLVSREKVDTRPVAMVVDDSITVRRFTQRLLERNGMRVITARDGQDAVALLQDNLPDVILLDIEMPRMDGYEVAAQVRANPRTSAVPIIMITSRVGDKHRSRALQLGVDDYLGKPYQEALLLKAIRPLIDRGPRGGGDPEGPGDGGPDGQLYAGLG